MKACLPQAVFWTCGLRVLYFTEDMQDATTEGSPNSPGDEHTLEDFASSEAKASPAEGVGGAPAAPADGVPAAPAAPADGVPAGFAAPAAYGKIAKKNTKFSAWLEHVGPIGRNTAVKDRELLR